MSNGYLPDGSGPDGAAYGRCPETGRAYKRNGEVRKARTIKTTDEVLNDLAMAEERAASGMGRKVLASIPGYQAFVGAFGTFKSNVAKAKRFSTDEGCEAERAKHEAALALIDTKHDLASEWLDDQGDTIEQANGVFAKVGKAYIAFSKAEKRSPTADEGAALVAEVVSAEAVASVIASADPANAPFASLTEAPEGDQTDDDDDSL